MEVKNTGFSLSVLLFFCCFFVEAFVAVNGRAIVSPKPDPADAAATARWLASQNLWGSLRYSLSIYNSVVESLLLHPNSVGLVLLLGVFVLLFYLLGINS